MAKLNQAGRARLMRAIKDGDRSAAEKLARLHARAGEQTLAQAARLAATNDAAWATLQQQARLMF